MPELDGWRTRRRTGATLAAGARRDGLRPVDIFVTTAFPKVIPCK